MSTEAFRVRRDGSIPAVEVVARWAEARGANVTIPTPPPIIPGHYSHDDGDIYVNGQRIEVKHRDVSFSRDRFPYPTSYICAVHQWEQAQPRPRRFCIVNHAMTGMLVFGVGSTRAHWTTRKHVYNRVEQRFNDLYECRVGLGKYHAL